MANFLSRVGIGSAEVDTILPTDSVVLGESLDARVEIEGGSSTQEIDHIDFAVATRYELEDGHATSAVERSTLDESFTISPGEERTEHVTIDVPYETPLTMGWDVWIKTGLDIDWSLDPKDTDHIEVEPDDRVAALLKAVESLGLSFHGSEVRRGSFYGTQTCVQELDFRAHSGAFAGDLDELELIPLASADSVEVVLEVDKRGGLLEEMTELDEANTILEFDHTDSQKLQEELRSTIQRHV